MDPLKKMEIQCSTSANWTIFIWLVVEALIRIGIRFGFAWLKGIEIPIGLVCLGTFAMNWVDFRILKITLQAMDEMQEYIDKRFEERTEESD